MSRMPSESLSVTEHAGSKAGVQILRVKGALTHISSSAFQEAVSAATAPCLILDLSEVPSVDSMAVGALVRAFVSCNKAGRKLAFVGLNHRIKNVLQLTGVDPLFDTYATIAQAEAALV
jgi:anti-sigma B factor antagonist